MATYSKKRLLPASATQIPQMAESIRQEFIYDGFEVNVETLLSGGVDISITKGNVFKAVLGMRSALKVTLIPQQTGVLFDANVGVFGQQAVPAVISMFFFWPVLITQIWGLVQQASLDDRALAAAERVLGGQQYQVPTQEPPVAAVGSANFCPECGQKVEPGSKFCPNCGAKL